MNNTPETDLLVNNQHHDCVPYDDAAGQLADLARKLERERNEARDTARWLYQHGMATLIEGASGNEWIKEEIK